MPEIDRITLSFPEHERFIADISEYRNNFDLNEGNNEDYIMIHLSDAFTKESILSAHVVLIACLVEFIHSKGYKALLSTDNKDVKSFFYETLRIADYFRGEKEYIQADDSRILNLWKVESNQATQYSRNTTYKLQNKTIMAMREVVKYLLPFVILA